MNTVFCSGQKFAPAELIVAAGLSYSPVVTTRLLSGEVYRMAENLWQSSEFFFQNFCSDLAKQNILPDPSPVLRRADL